MENLEKYIASLANLKLMAERAKTSLSDLQNRMASGDTGSAALFQKQLQDATALVSTYKTLQKELTKLQAIQEKSGVYGKVSGGATKTPASDTPPVTATKGGDIRFNLEGVDTRFKSALNNLISSLNLGADRIAADAKLKPNLDGTRAIFTGQYKDASGDMRNFKFFLDNLGNFGRNIKELNARAFVGTEVGSRVADYARQRGYDPFTDLKKVLRYEQGAYGTARFSRDVGGITSEDVVRFDKQGNLSSQVPPQKQFRSFTQDIQRDLGDLLKWSVAITAIYGPINAITEAIGLMIQNETELADVSVALNEEVSNTGMVFETVFDSSQRAGESIQGVIEAFGQAYRAAGRVSNEYQRYNTSVQLLNDSLVLSKLSTLDQTEAIDVLTAALYQTAPAGESAANALSRGQDLLDKWVRVSKIASVDVETLATGVAVLGDSAETAGLSVDQLNALVATLAETSIVSGKEAANVAKALIGNYQSESAVRELNRLGIAVTDVSGKTRQFMSVMTEVAAMRESGLIGNEDFNRLTLALGGGGIRRQKDVAAFIENFGRMQQITAAQQGSGGEASEALAKKLDTVNTSATKLSNSFQNLVQSMGDEGGLLDVFTAFIDVGTLTVDVFDQLISRAGKVGPLLVGVAAAFAVFRNKDITASLMNNLNMSAGMAEWITGKRNVLGGNMISGSPLRNAIGRATTLPSVAAVALPAIQNFSSGDTEEGVANVAGGIVGALVGGPVGALVGSAIAEGFVRSTLTYETEFANFFAGAVEKGGQSQGTALSRVRTPQELETAAFESLGGGSQALGKLLALMKRTLTSDFVVQNTPFGKLFGQKIREAGGTSGQYNTTEAAAFNMLKRTNPDLYQEMMAAYAAQGGQLPGTEAPLTSRENILFSTNKDYLRGLQGQRQSDITQQLISGEIKPSDYARRTASLSAFSVSATKGTAALVDEYGNLDDEFGTLEDNYRDFLDIFSSGNDELINQINSQVTAVATLQNIWDNWDPSKKEMEFINPLTGESMVGTRDELQNLLGLTRQSLANTRDYGAEQVRLQNLKLPEIFGSYTSPSFANTNELNAVLQEALKRQEMFYRSPEGGALDSETYEALTKSFEDFSTLVGEAGDTFYKKITEGVDRKFFDEVYKQYQEEGKISGDGKGTPWSALDASAADIRKAEAMAPEYVRRLESMGYESEVTDALYSTSDEQIVKAHGDQKVIQYLLQQILDTEKKQLQGVWNLPEGATAWVPYQSVFGDMLGDKTGLDDFTYPTTSDSKYSDIPGEELSMYGYDSLQDLIDELAGRLTSDDSGYAGGMRKDRGGEFDSQELGGRGERDMIGKMDSFFSRLMDLIGNLTGTRDIVESAYGGTGGRDMSRSGSPLKQSSDAQSVNTKLDIKFSSTTQLMVDGRVLASIVKPYLAADLLRANESGGTVTRNYVI